MIWLEIRVTQGHGFDTGEEHDLAEIIEEAIDVPARRVFCEAEHNLMWCYVRFDRDRMNASQLNFYRMELRNAFSDELSRSIDEINVTTDEAVAEHIPEAV